MTIPSPLPIRDMKCKECKVVPKFAAHQNADGFLWFECPKCGMKYSTEDVNIPEDYCVGFNTTA